MILYILLFVQFFYFLLWKRDWILESCLNCDWSYI